MNLPVILAYVSAFFGVFSASIYLLTFYENKERMSNPKAKRLLKTSIVVPAFNEEGRIKRTVESLLNLNYPKELIEIILVDDGSTDNTFNEMQTFCSDSVKVFHKKNGGKASALNLGIKNANGEIIVSLDADSFVDKDALINMVGYFEDERCMAVTPSMKIWKPKTILQKVQFVEFLFGIFLRKMSAFLGCINVTPGPFSAYRKSFFDKYGGYEEGNLTEDIEVALRIQANDFIIENSPNAYSYTPGPSKFRSLFKQRVRWYLGFLNNTLKYRRLFSRRYGTLGLFFMPSAFVFIIFNILIVSYMIYKLTGGIYKSFSNLLSINFDLFKIIPFKFDTFYLPPNMTTIIMSTTFTVTILAVYIARKISNDKEKVASPFFLSILLYAPLFALWWATSILYKISGKTIKWSGVPWRKD